MGKYKWKCDLLTDRRKGMEQEEEQDGGMFGIFSLRAVLYKVKPYQTLAGGWSLFEF